MSSLGTPADRPARCAPGQAHRQSSWSRRACVVLILAAATCCVYQVPWQSAMEIELSAKTDAGPSQGKPAAVARGRGRVRGHDALKQKAEREDKQSRRVRLQANKDYDNAHELMRQAGVLTHKMARLSKGEGALKSLIEEVQIVAPRVACSTSTAGCWLASSFSKASWPAGRIKTRSRPTSEAWRESAYLRRRSRR